MLHRLVPINSEAFIDHEVKLLGEGWNRARYIQHVAFSLGIGTSMAQSVILASVPRHFTIVPSRPYERDEAAYFVTTGCHGEESTAQFRVARLINEVACSPKRPLFTLLLGDNVYNDGATNATDRQFHPVFHDLYLGPSPLLILGNHDYNNHTQRMKLKRNIPEYGLARGMHQILHTFTTPDGNISEADLYRRLQYIEGGVVTLDDPTKPGWFMPCRFGSYTFKDFPGNPDNKQKTMLIVADANTYVQEFVEMMDCLEREEDVSPYNQARWLEDCITYANQESIKVILAIHHPPETQGTRAYHSDYRIYLHTKKAIALAKKYLSNCFVSRTNPNLPHEPSYNALEFEVLTQQFERLKRTVPNLQSLVHTVFSAHDHSNSLYNNLDDKNARMPLIQITVGGGGSKLQERGWYGDQRQLAYFADRYGYLKVTCSKNPAVLKYELHAIEGVVEDNKADKQAEKMHHITTSVMRFTNQSNDALHDYHGMSEEEIEAIITFRLTVCNALREYFDFIHRQQERTHGNYFSATNLKHGYTGVKRVHAIWNYLNQHRCDDYLATLCAVQSLSAWDTGHASFLVKLGIFNATTPTPDSFIVILENHIKQGYRGATLEQLIDLAKKVETTNALVPSTSHPHS